jgi:hypothetical protein
MKMRKDHQLAPARSHDHAHHLTNGHRYHSALVVARRERPGLPALDTHEPQKALSGRAQARQTVFAAEGASSRRDPGSV